MSHGRYTAPGRRRLTTDEIDEYIWQHVGRVDDFEWYFDPAVPVGDLKAHFDGTHPSVVSPRDWIRWLARERQRALDEEAIEPWGSDFVHWFTSGGSWEEDGAVVATEQGSGFGVEDGNHRVAVAHEQDMPTVRAYLGVLKVRR